MGLRSKDMTDIDAGALALARGNPEMAATMDRSRFFRCSITGRLGGSSHEHPSLLCRTAAPYSQRKQRMATKAKTSV